ncbi:sigma-70 family RNA polymerase sigma factor [Neobacillus sp. Marseille-QA0830]
MFMIPAKIDSIPINRIRERSVESIFDWFEFHLKSFYTLGWSYLSNQQQMEELFYQSIIKVHKTLPRFKSETSFETWVTSIFIQTCRELSKDGSLVTSEENEPRQEFFKALDHLKEDEKEAVILTYVKGMSKEEAAQLLHVSVEVLKEILFSGIRSLRKEIGYIFTFNGCREYHKDYIDYIERNMERSKKVDFEIHIYHCQDCQEDLATFQEVMLNLTEEIEALQVPSGFMNHVKARLADKEKQRQKKTSKRKKIGLIFAGALALLLGIGYFTGAFTYLYYTTEKNPQLRAYLQQGFGDRLSLEEESNGVKIRIKGIIADDVQTLVFYEIEDTEENNQYMINYDDGVFVENRYDIMEREANTRYYPPDLESDVNKKEKNVFQGKISLQPLSKENGTIKLKIAKLQKLIRDSSDQIEASDYEDMFETGEWDFEVPVTKQPSKEYVLEKETELEGIPFRVDKLILAPTATILQYSLNNNQSGKRIDAVNFDNLEVNQRKVKPDMYGGAFIDSPQDPNWYTFQTNFDSLFGEKPKEVNIHFGAISLTVEEQKAVELDAAKGYPQTFEYAGSTISIDKLEDGQSTKMVISNREIENRAYESLQFFFVGEDENSPVTTDMNFEGVFIDKNGIEYNENQTPFSYEEIEQPRYFITVQTMGLLSDATTEEVTPKRLQIFGYTTTTYPDDVVKILLK